MVQQGALSPFINLYSYVKSVQRIYIMAHEHQLEYCNSHYSLL